MTSPFQSALQTASFRGCEFEIVAVSTVHGRKSATHEYPNRDEVWVEDLGRRAREIKITGVVLAPNGPSAIDALISAVEEEGTGSLVHPALGSITAACINFVADLAADDGAVVQFNATFLESSDAAAPASISNAFDAVGRAADNLDTSSLSSFTKSAGNLIRASRSAVTAVVSTGQSYVRDVQGVVRSATSVMGSVTGIAGSFGGSFGRFATGSRLLTSPLSSVNGVISTASGAISRATSAVRGVETLATRVSSLAARL